MVTCLQDIQELVREGFSDWKSLGDVKVVEHNHMLLFNYRYPKEWNAFECLSRGLILMRNTGVIVARPFDKFFNWLEGGRKGTGHIVSIMEKMDGSMGSIYSDPVDGVVKVATRGSFTGEQAAWATDYLNRNFHVDRLPLSTHTPIVEIIYPDNQIVVDYENKEYLVLLGMRNKEDGSYMSWFPNIVSNNQNWWNFDLPKMYSFNSLTELLEATGDAEFQRMEGWVVEMSDGTRWKFKTDEYIELHRIMSRITPKNIVKYYLQDLDKTLPPPAYEKYKDIYDQAMREGFKKYGPIVHEIDELFNKAYKSGTRKDFALWVMEHAPQYSAALFDLYDDKDPSYMIVDKYVEW